MNNNLARAEREVLMARIRAERDILSDIEQQYQEALDAINSHIAQLLGRQDANLPHVIHRVEYQRMLKQQIQAALDKLHSMEYESITEYLNESYTDAFVGTVYTLHHQDMPVILPINQALVIKAITLDTRLKKTLYEEMGKDINKLKRVIQQEITRGISSGMMYSEIAKNISNQAGIPMRRAKTIARTEGGRVQEQASYDAALQAMEKGADLVKQWSAIRDGKTRDAHRMLHMQTREMNEPFEIDGKEAMYPHDFGDPALDCNCRCTMLKVARAALDADVLKQMQEDAHFHGLMVKDSKELGHAQAKNIAEFKKRYLKAADQEYLRGNLPEDFKDTRKIGERIKQDDLHEVIERARLKGVQIGTEGNPTGGFENYCGDLAVLDDVIDQAAKQLDSDLFKNSKGSKIILKYDNILDGSKVGQVVDINTFAMTNGKTITLNKFMYDDSTYLAKQYAEAVLAGLFPKGTDYTCIIAHEAGHIIDKFTRGLRKKVVSVVESAAHQEGLSIDEYIIKNVSIYGAHLDSRLDYHELISELNSMLNSGRKYGIIELLRKAGVFR